MAIPSAAHASRDERILAAVAHGTVALPYLGFIAPLAIWITQRDWSQFVAFHALQALLFQISMAVILTMISLCGFAGIIPPLLGTINPALGNVPEWLYFIPLGVQLIWVASVLLILATFIALGLTATMRTLSGRDYSYPIIGRQMKS
jgi:uncharacterized Tic20 family protein